MSIDTRKATGRRDVRYANLDEVLADAERLAAGPIECLGNWSAGQIFLHLARGMNASIDGTNMRAPWIVRLVARYVMKQRILNGPMQPGLKMPPAVAKVFEPAETSTAAGLEELRRAVARQKTESRRSPSPFLGELTREEYDRLHLSHAALHMSFLKG
jgi:uncharacterized protein DUF1569